MSYHNLPVRKGLLRSIIHKGKYGQMWDSYTDQVQWIIRTIILNDSTFAIKYKVLLRDSGHLILSHGMNKSICNHLIITTVPGRNNNFGAQITGLTFVCTLASVTKCKSLMPIQATVRTTEFHEILCFKSLYR